MAVPLKTRCAAEVFGTFWLVLGGCGSAVFAAGIIGTLGVSLAFGLTVLTMAYCLGPISGCHLNPAVTLGLVSAKRFPARESVPYIVSQVIGAIVATAVIALIARGNPAFDFTNASFAANGYGANSPDGYGLLSGIVAEFVMTFAFLMVILGSNDDRAPKNFAGIAIGMALTLIHLISIPVTNTSVNPARSTGPALFAGLGYVAQLWMFWLVPLAAAWCAGKIYQSVFGKAELADVDRDENVFRPRAVS